MRVLFVCLGNICRSPLAEGLLQQKIERQGLDWTIDSAGTGHWHVGEQPDPRSIDVARKHGLDITYQRARQFGQDDFDRFDLILTMDRTNYRNVLSMARTKEEQDKVKLVLGYLDSNIDRDVPDPYWDDDGFEKVYQLLDRVTDAILKSHT